MSLQKRTYVSGATIITAENLNDIQDSIISLEGKNIPNASSSDNGKFLRIVEGKPAWASLTNVAEEGA